MHWYKNLRLRTKIILGFIATAILTIMVGWQGINATKTMGDSSDRLYREGVTGIRVTGQIIQNFGNMRQRIRDIIIMANNPEVQRINKQEYDANREAIIRHYDELKEIVKDDPAVTQLVSKASSTFGDWVKIVDQVVDFAMVGKTQDAIQQMTVTAVPVNREHLRELDEMAAAMDKTAETIDEHNTSVRRKASIMIIVINLVVVAASILLGTTVSNMIVGSLDKISLIIKKVAMGDLTAHFIAESKDELGVMSVRLEKMVNQTWDFINKVNEGIDSVANYAAELLLSADEMSNSIEQISHSADVQRSGFEKMAAVMAELSASIEEVSRSAQNSITQLGTALEVLRQHGFADEAIGGAMEDITQKTGEITQAIGVIRKIAHNSNLLSLNVAFGVAKVGEQGKDLTAVAEEARNLTERSAVSAMEVIRHNIEARDSMQRGGEAVIDTVELLRDVKASLDQFEIQAGGRTAPTSEQSKTGADAARQTEISVNESTSLSSAMSAATNEVAHTATELAHLASELQAQIRQFKLKNDKK